MVPVLPIGSYKSTVGSQILKHIVGDLEFSERSANMTMVHAQWKKKSESGPGKIFNTRHMYT